MSNIKQTVIDELSNWFDEYDDEHLERAAEGILYELRDMGHPVLGQVVENLNTAVRNLQAMQSQVRDALAACSLLIATLPSSPTPGEEPAEKT